MPEQNELVAPGPVQIAVLPGDGVGPEVTQQAVRVLELVDSTRSLGLKFVEGLLGGCAIEATGTPLPVQTLQLCEQSVAALVGAVGGEKWDRLPAEVNPGPGGLLRLRREFDLFANVRPGIGYLADSIKVKTTDIDILLIREAVGGAYFSNPRGRRSDETDQYAYDTMKYSASQVRRIAILACEMAMQRGRRLTSVDKANVLESSKLWREVMLEVVADYPDLEVDHLYVDNCAMQLVLRPETFDVIVTENLFGDILSDEIAGLVGSLGLLPSASLRGDRWGLYEPIHGSAPSIAGLDLVNPTAAILSAGLLLRHSLGLNTEADLVERAVVDTLNAGIRTADIVEEGRESVGTVAFGDAVCERLKRLLHA